MKNNIESDFPPFGNPKSESASQQFGINDKAKGLGNEIVGNIKQAAGKVSGNERLQAEGIVQERKGEGQNLKGKMKGMIGDKV